jgi:hypothetical protein
MPKQQTHVGKVRLWLSSLGVLAAVSISRQEAEMKLAAFVPMLLDRFPDAAFTPASLEHCAARCAKGFPTYAELCGYLSEWWKANRPASPALPAPPPIRQRAEPTIEEIEHVSRVTRETVAWLRSSEQPEADRRPTARYLSPGVLDLINPLPNGRKRTDAATSTSVVLDADPPAGMAWADSAPANDGDDWPPSAA